MRTLLKVNTKSQKMGNRNKVVLNPIKEERRRNNVRKKREGKNRNKKKNRRTKVRRQRGVKRRKAVTTAM